VRSRFINLASLTAALVASTSFAAASDQSPRMEITRKAEQTTTTGADDYFTGKVAITAQFQRPAPSRIGGAIVRFEPGARTAWHKHPLGQTLIVTEGIGWTQVEDGPIQEFRAGDILWCPPGRRHWHGAAPQAGMSHIAIQESVDGSPVTWMEKVTDAQYLSGAVGG
jgi:quercetin dioxygenase-like cupin family protein